MRRSYEFWAVPHLPQADPLGPVHHQRTSEHPGERPVPLLPGEAVPRGEAPGRGRHVPLAEARTKGEAVTEPFYSWKKLESPVDTEGMTKEEWEALCNLKIMEAIGDMRQLLGLPREPGPVEIEASHYCHECGRLFDEENE
jgi:hypothetical protein